MNLEVINILIAKGEYQEKNYSLNQTIHNDRVSSNTLYFIKSGIVSINKLNANGESDILLLLGAKDFFGLRSIFYPILDQPVFSLSKSDHTIVYEFNKKKILEYYDNNLFIQEEILHLILQRIYIIEDRIDILVKPTIRNRLFYSMLDIERRFKNTLQYSYHGNSSFHFPLSQNDLGKYCRGARENICKAAHHLKKKSKFIEQAIKSRVRSSENLN